MSVYLSEDEQLEEIKKWWKRYGNMVSTIVLIAMCIVLAGQWWQRHQTNMTQSASTAYEQLISSLATHDESTARVSAVSIIEKYPSTPYAEMSNLILARFDVEKSDYPSALQHLNKVIDSGKTKAIAQIARIRSARILLAQQKSAEGLKVLDKVIDPSFQALIDETKGDCYLASGDKPKARIAYNDALKLMPTKGGATYLLQIKINDLPGENV